jgi:hypothetical protein
MFMENVCVKLFIKVCLLALFPLRLNIGASVQFGIEKYPRMRLKRDVIFGFVDLWGELLCYLMRISHNFILVSEKYLELCITYNHLVCSAGPKHALKTNLSLILFRIYSASESSFLLKQI